MQGEHHTDPRMLVMSDWGGHIDLYDIWICPQIFELRFMNFSNRLYDGIFPFHQDYSF